MSRQRLLGTVRGSSGADAEGRLNGFLQPLCNMLQRRGPRQYMKWSKFGGLGGKGFFVDSNCWPEREGEVLIRSRRPLDDLLWSIHRQLIRDRGHFFQSSSYYALCFFVATKKHMALLVKRALGFSHLIVIVFCCSIFNVAVL